LTKLHPAKNPSNYQIVCIPEAFQCTHPIHSTTYIRTQFVDLVLFPVGVRVFMKSSMCTNNKFCNEGDMNCWPISSILSPEGVGAKCPLFKGNFTPLWVDLLFTSEPPNYLDGPIKYLFTCEPPNYLDGPIKYLFTCEPPTIWMDPLSTYSHVNPPTIWMDPLGTYSHVKPPTIWMASPLKQSRGWAYHGNTHSTADPILS
jgi:hypothetical protein